MGVQFAQHTRWNKASKMSQNAFYRIPRAAHGSKSNGKPSSSRFVRAPDINTPRGCACMFVRATHTPPSFVLRTLKRSASGCVRVTDRDGRPVEARRRTRERQAGDAQTLEPARPPATAGGPAGGAIDVHGVTETAGLLLRKPSPPASVAGVCARNAEPISSLRGGLRHPRYEISLEISRLVGSPPRPPPAPPLLHSYFRAFLFLYDDITCRPSVIITYTYLTPQTTRGLRRRVSLSKHHWQGGHKPGAQLDPLARLGSLEQRLLLAHW